MIEISSPVRRLSITRLVLHLMLHCRKNSNSNLNKMWLKRIIPLSTYVLPEGHETGVPKFEVIQSTTDSYQTAPRVFADSQGQGLSSTTWYTAMRQAVTTFRARNWSCTNGETSRNPCPSGRTWARPITSRDFFFKKNWRLAIRWQISPGEQRCGLCCLFVWPLVTLKYCLRWVWGGRERCSLVQST